MGQTLISFEFIVFFAVVFIAYYSLARRYQWQFLLIVSYVFYALNNRWEYTFLLAAVTGINFLAGILIQNAAQKSVERFYLMLSLGLNICVLFIFKYNHFLGIPLRLHGSGISAAGRAMAVPLGISYFTFKVISYSVDIYRAKMKCEKNIGKFALFISFFPEISAGPIDRAKELLPQMVSPKLFMYDDAVSGLRLMLWGFFKKVVIANNLAIYVNQIFNSPREYSGSPLIIAIYFLAFQLYADFSGYTDIVRGAGRILGYRLPENFISPYFSKSISEFWTRWHITLSTWLRDYLFLPLSFFFSKRIKSSYVLFLNSNVLIYFSSALITFMIAGVWHGSTWTFIIWGLLHGFYLSFSNLTKSLRKKLRRKFSFHHKYPRLITFIQTLFCFHLVTLSWIFFRASSIRDALYIVRKMFSLNIANLAHGFFNPLELLRLGESKYGLIVSALAVLFLVVVEMKQKGQEIPHFLISKRRLLRWAAYYFILLSIFLLGEFGLKEFIYVQF